MFTSGSNNEHQNFHAKEKKNGKGIVGPHATVRDGLRN